MSVQNFSFLARLEVAEKFVVVVVVGWWGGGGGPGQVQGSALVKLNNIKLGKKCSYCAQFLQKSVYPVSYCNSNTAHYQSPKKCIKIQNLSNMHHAIFPQSLTIPHNLTLPHNSTLPSNATLPHDSTLPHHSKLYLFIKSKYKKPYPLCVLQISRLPSGSKKVSS